MPRVVVRVFYINSHVCQSCAAAESTQAYGDNRVRDDYGC